MLSHANQWLLLKPYHISRINNAFVFCFPNHSRDCIEKKNLYILLFLGSCQSLFYFLLFILTQIFYLYPAQPFHFNIHRALLRWFFFSITFHSSMMFCFLISAQCSSLLIFLNKCGLLIWKHCVSRHAGSFKYVVIEKLSCFWQPLTISGNNDVLTLELSSM